VRLVLFLGSVAHQSIKLGFEVGERIDEFLENRLAVGASP
jgi:hypothetical protein